jgi:hypothetical protein
MPRRDIAPISRRFGSTLHSIFLTFPSARLHRCRPMATLCAGEKAFEKWRGDAGAKPAPAPAV